ncbi:putative ABC transport system permease protein [Neolewinella xylanilytica]|uniref:Putative ABC transport system permease protein n=1 Tax=Neolewinella xylanilytica TaxID=1514080 RepID=A0A2S6I748_9BACT|nr:ABC transporter permease [Neolewinella xylanilytica]PPK87279.1 putative ABC transport system permease protein [Neolewinella xylanilytica]
MIKNYLTLALKVLRRKPFYTFISLFGISFTLMILMLITSMGDALFGANRPMSDVNRMVFLPMLERYTEFYDTLYAVDTIVMDDGTLRYDSTETLEPNGSMNNSNGQMSFSFLDKNLRGLSDVESYTFVSNSSFTDAYLDGRKVTMSTSYVDASYWEVFDFRFLHGLPFGVDDVAEANKVAVITERIADSYFGEMNPGIIGREMILGNETFRVVGIVERPLKDDDTIAGDIFLPLTTIDARQYANTETYGPFQAVFKATSAAKRESIKQQLTFLAENFVIPPDADYEHIRLYAGTATENFAANLMQESDASKAKLLLFVPLITLLVLFLALPLINLINLNVSRVFERKSEIAVRKAFGAESRDILYQFIFENLVLTFIGGFIGLVLAYLIIQYVNANDLIGIVRLSFSGKIFFYFILVILLFGLLSGILPAYRMSRTTIATALR